MSKKIRYLLILPLVLVLSVGIFAPGASAAGPIGAVECEDCQVDEYGLDCEQKVLLTLPVTYGMEEYMEILDVRQINKNGEPLTIEETYTVSVTKTMPEEIYPLKYLHTVSYFPYEQVRQVNHPSSGCPGCTDCGSADNPSCGWTYHGTQIVEDSQGFCIVRDFDDTGMTCTRFRGEELIGYPSTVDDPYATAHCLRLGELYYDGYEIGEFLTDYEIEVNVVKGEEDFTFTISPDDPLYSCRDDQNYNGDMRLKAELIGDMDEMTGAIELDNYILYIPSSPETHPFVQDYQNNMLLVPREELSRDGSEPDKVGVSFYTFRRLSDDYAVSVAGDGLHNQLFQKHNEDLMKLITNPNAQTDWLVHGMRDFKGSMNFAPGMPMVLKHKIPCIDNSLVQFTLDADTVKTIRTESVGAIIAAWVQTFPSMSEDGTLNVEIGNFGDLKSDYIVTVTDASMNILPAFPAQARTLEPYESTYVKFDVYTNYNLDTTNEFLVTLKSPTGRIYDQTYVIFDTLKHGKDYPWDLQLKNNGSQVQNAMAPCGSDLYPTEYRFSLYHDPAVQWDPYPDLFRSYQDVYVVNDGPADAYNVMATVTYAPANVTVLDGTVSLGNIPVGGGAWSLDAFGLEVDMTNPQDPCDGILWRIDYQDADGNSFTIENVTQFPPGLGPCD